MSSSIIPLFEYNTASNTDTYSSALSILVCNDVSRTGRAIEPTYSISHQLNKDLHQKSQRLNTLSIDVEACQDQQLLELHSLDLANMTKKERRELRSTNSKFKMKWKLVNDKIKPKDFGEQWGKGFKIYLRSEWERFSYLAAVSKYSS
jgi:hypothetical protein